MDLGTGLALLGAARIVEKLLGPTAEYVGEGLKDWTERGVRNVQRIFENAIRMLGDGIDEDETVPPRVLRAVLDEGAFIEDELAAEYFGGLMASSRSPDGEDDRAVTWLALASRLSATTLRLHYSLYLSTHLLYKGREVNDSTEMREIEIFVPEGDILRVTQVDKLPKDENAILSHAHSAMVREDLCTRLHWAILDDLGNSHGAPGLVGKDRGVVFAPSPTGSEFFLWANGLGRNHWAGDLTSEGIRIDEFEGIPTLQSAQLLSDFK